MPVGDSYFMGHLITKNSIVSQGTVKGTLTLHLLDNRVSRSVSPSPV